MSWPNQFLIKLFNLVEADSQITYLVFFGLSFILIPVCFWQAHKKQKRIMDPNNNNSYCVISIYMLMILKFSLVLQFLLNIVIMVLFIYEKEIESPYFYIVLKVMLYVPWICGNGINISQFYEWLAMFYVIYIQKQKNLSEIMFEINNST